MKKRAFTLTELLVVVVIIGVLSAVVLPKFTKVLQTRKTTEAENVMAAVRNEQEARCMVGRNYVGQNEISKLASLPKATSKNYTYTLGAQGITATAKDGNYTLQIPSYADGRICCSGEGCEKLNKDYPTCNDTFLAAIDQSACEAPEVPENQDPEPTPAPEPEPAVCEHPTNPDAAEDCERSGGTWNAQDCTCACPEGTHDDGSATCLPDKTYCEYGKPGWNQWRDKAQDCEQPQDPDATAGTWNTSTCKCDCPEGTVPDAGGEGCLPVCAKTNENLGHSQLCEQPQDPAGVEGTWAWEGANACKCICPAGSTLDKYGECISSCAKTNENLAKAQTCEQPQASNAVAGTWNDTTCRCDCPSGTSLVNGQCMTACDMTKQENLNRRQDCEQGGQGDDFVAGTWSNETCDCVCPAGSSPHAEGGCVKQGACAWVWYAEIAGYYYDGAECNNELADRLAADMRRDGGSPSPGEPCSRAGDMGDLIDGFCYGSQMEVRYPICVCNRNCEAYTRVGRRVMSGDCK